jgi:hypothetical protein
MPSVSGWALRLPGGIGFELRPERYPDTGFYALGIGLGFATMSRAKRSTSARFYALGIGLGFATNGSLISSAVHQKGFYALGIGLGFATGVGIVVLWVAHVYVSMPSVSGWALRLHRLTSPRYVDGNVSMPSVSGWALRPTGQIRGVPRALQRFYALGIGLGFATDALWGCA